MNKHKLTAVYNKLLFLMLKKMKAITPQWRSGGGGKGG